MELPRIHDLDGSEQDWDWLVATIGGVKLERADAAEKVGQVFRIVGLQVIEGVPIQRVRVLDQQGNPLQGVRVVRAWPDGPSLPRWLPPASRWRECGVFGLTDSSGEIGFGMGYGDTYSLPGVGTSTVWVAEDAGPSDLIDGLGMLEGGRSRHLDVTFQLQDVGGESLPPPSPSPPPTPPKPHSAPPQPEPMTPAGESDWAKISDKLDRILDLLQKESHEP